VADLRHEQGARTELAVHWRGAGKPGWYRCELAVYADEAADALGAPLPCAFEVVPEVDVFPPSLSVDGKDPGERWERKLTVRPAAVQRPDAGITVEWSDARAGPVIRTVTRKTGDGSYTVELAGSLAELKSLGTSEITLNITLGSVGPVTVPLRLVADTED
jgi:hypothetical protein